MEDLLVLLCLNKLVLSFHTTQPIIVFTLFGMINDQSLKCKLVIFKCLKYYSIVLKFHVDIVVVKLCI